MMDSKNRFQEKFQGIFSEYTESRKRIYTTIPAASLRKVAGFLFNDLAARFIIASGFDNGKEIEILYHFSFDSSGEIISLRVFLERNKPEVDSLAPLFRGAFWIEREIWEMLGVNFREHPRLEKFLFSEDWPESYHPYQVPSDRTNRPPKAPPAQGKLEF
ncbi:MAG: NADH-quinone oxidoreductase subunit C [Candidatus Ratteibacteria bacterium]|jgi:NADH-quinone oxidoreductase subunit C